MNILAVIPARGGSKGIPRKNVRLMNGKPLISYAITNALSCDLITDVVVTTDDNEIENISRLYGSEVVRRGENLSGDAVTLDPVIYDAVLQMEHMKGYEYDIVITLQPTSPLLKSKTLIKAINDFIKGNVDTYISAINKPHLSWGKNDTGFYPMYEKRLNRQQLPPHYLETGAFVITKREFVQNNSRFGNKISVYEIPENESIDIDTKEDWNACEVILKRKKIILRCDGYKKIGMGHIYHCLTLAYNLIDHDVLLVTNSNHEEGLAKIKDSFLPYKTITSDADFIEFIKDYKPDIIVNDCLDTDADYVKELKKYCKRVVTIEDMGTGISYADVVINALYSEHTLPNVYSGEEYVSLRDEFLINTPKDFEPKAKEVLILFGGTDPSGLTEKVYNLFKNNNNDDLHYTFILGIGYNGIINESINDRPSNFDILKDVKDISSYMRKADIALTSQGRTIYELASLGVPSIVLAQNEREKLHTFAQISNGFVNLGLGTEVEELKILKTFEWLATSYESRYELRNLMLSKDLKKGLSREIELILGE